MASFGNIEHFNVNDSKSWDSYKERLDFYLTANDITDAGKKKAVFLSICGPATYDIIRSLIAPMKVTKKTYEEIIKALSDHFAPRTSEIVSRFKFYQRDQHPEESISVYIKELRRLAESCEFDNLEIMLRDRLVCGVRDDGLQRRLLAEENITFKKAHDMCLAYEVAARSLAIIKEGGGQSADVHDVNAREKVNKDPSKLKTSVSRVSKRCFRCEEKHSPDSCVYKNAKCKFCWKIGHVEHACFSKKKHSKQKLKVNQQSSESSFENVPQNENSSEDQVYHFSLYSVKSDSITGTILQR
ncbi:uncharacterized protein LOC132698531 [Cylas formicarius]|uniref:uncharacterized protein LOC132698531 n=1 Tax=Cylas formicarius TaxID=197179 RepID=UPI0029588F5E|nr:uncharacterized protein LOC132698531 [Cylas formicarius]